MRLCWIALIAAALAACSSQPAGQRAAAVNTAASCSRLDNDQELVVNVSQELVQDGRLHAALANLESLPENLPAVRLHKARILRVLGDRRAEGMYRSLLDTCLVAAGHHGLGQIAAADGRYQEAFEQLRTAAHLTPADGLVRNDLGLVLMHLGRLSEARFELITAVELNDANPQPLENLLTLLIYQDRWQEAGELVKKKGLPPEHFQLAEERARKLRLPALPQDEAGRSDASRKGVIQYRLQAVETMP
jgi:Flp pilus assembly protein TadD